MGPATTLSAAEVSLFSLSDVGAGAPSRRAVPGDGLGGDDAGLTLALAGS